MIGGPHGPGRKLPQPNRTAFVLGLGDVKESFLHGMNATSPGFFRKVEDTQRGQTLQLSEQEKNFLINAVLSDTEGMSRIIIRIAEKIWNAKKIGWLESDGKPREGEIAQTIWKHFSFVSVKGAREAIEFFLDTSKEEAEAKIATWPEWKGRTNIMLR